VAAEWRIEPFDSFGPLRFGMTRGEVASALNEAPQQFAKGFSPNIVEAYNDSGVHAYYDADERLEFIEAFSPCQPSYGDVDLLRADAAATVSELSALGLAMRDDGEGGIWFEDHGFALYAPGGRTEGVSVFRRGYDTGA
jgi:hypothetical protein